jgi:hypothetical protein
VHQGQGTYYQGQGKTDVLGYLKGTKEKVMMVWPEGIFKVTKILPRWNEKSLLFP